MSDVNWDTTKMLLEFNEVEMLQTGSMTTCDSVSSWRVLLSVYPTVNPKLLDTSLLAETYNVTLDMSIDPQDTIWTVAYVATT